MLRWKFWQKESPVKEAPEAEEVDPQAKLKLDLSGLSKSPEVTEAYLELDLALREEANSNLQQMMVAAFLWGEESGIAKVVTHDWKMPDRPRGDWLRTDREPRPEQALLYAKAGAKAKDRLTGGYHTAVTFEDPTSPFGPDGQIKYEISKVKQEHKPLPPRSATVMPPKLTWDEEEALRIQSVMAKHLVSPPKLKPALIKKEKEHSRGPRRVYFTDDGKMKEVKLKTS